MIANLENVMPWIVKAMMDSHVEFHLTGSRFFGYQSDVSDWDFMVEHTNAVEDWLLEQGFAVDGDSSYTDPWITKVMRAEFFTIVKGLMVPVKVDVQLVTNVASKLHVQKVLQQHFLRRGYPEDKEVRKQMWELAYSMMNSRPVIRTLEPA